MKEIDPNISPVGWYVGSYIIRFIEVEDENNADEESEFLTWENTVIVKANSLEEAYTKVEVIGKEHDSPYKGGKEGVRVNWIYEGVTSLLPIYEDLEDGAEIMWTERENLKLRNLRRMVQPLESLKNVKLNKPWDIP
jgi:hypothetical protein